MLRVLIGSGLLLMAVGFGAAGWQYLSNLPAQPAGQDLAAQAGVLPSGQTGWLVSPTGGLIPAEDVHGYLAQDRLVPGRVATIVQTAPLTDLLGEGDSLPAEPYLQVFADIRAARLADALCPALLASVAQDCAVQSARVVPGSVDPVRGTARFQIDLAFRLKPEAAALPDLGERVFQTETLAIGVTAASAEAEAEDPPLEEAPAEQTAADSVAPAPQDATAAAALTTIFSAAQAACAADDNRETCRIMSLSLDWAPGSPTTGQARIGWLSGLPEGMYPAPSLDPAAAEPQG